MVETAKFMFGDVFDDGRLRQFRQADTPKFAEEDLERARQEAFTEGKGVGAAEARAGIEAANAKALDAIAHGLTALGAAQAEANEASRRAAVEFACLIAGKLAAALVAEQPLAEIEALVGDCLQHVGDEPRVVVLLCEAAIDGLAARIDGIAERSGFPGKVVLLPDDGVAAGDCRVEWADGGAVRTQDALLAEVEAAVAQYMQAVPADSGPVTGQPSATEGSPTPPEPEETQERE